MKKVLCYLLSALSVGLLSMSASAASEEEILQKLQKALPQFSIESVTEHPGSGLYVVKLANGPVLHATPDGSYFIAGDLYRVEETKLTNETEQAKLAVIESLSEDQMVIFPATGETLAHVTVFTDVDCGYCRMLHKEVPKLNEMGVTVRYLAYPRAGVGSPAYEKLVNIWCSANPQEWLTKAKQGLEVPENKCANPVADQYRLGNSVGVRGTPSLILGNGKFIPGYLSADQLKKELGI